MTSTLLNKAVLPVLEKQFSGLVRSIQEASSKQSFRDFEIPVAAFLAARTVEKTGSLVVVAPGDEEADSFAADCRAFGAEAEVFPWWKTLPYRPLDASADIFGQRCAVMAGILASERPGIIVLPLRSLVTPVPAPDYMRTLMRSVRVGETLDVTGFAGNLESWGFLRVPRVSVPGEFALRGEVLDIYLDRKSVV